jgi:hypothetical protein
MDTVPGEGDVAKMGLLNRQPWINFLALLPGTTLTVLTIAVAFLRFYDEQDFSFLGYVTQPRLWSNRFTVAAVVVAMVNFGVEWDRRNRETYRLAAEAQRRAEEEQRRVEEEQRSAAERERAARRARIEARCRAAQIRFQLAPSDEHRQMLTAVLAILEEYGETL